MEQLTVISEETIGSDKVEQLTILEPVQEEHKRGLRFWMSFVTIMVTTFIASLELVFLFLNVK